MVASYTDKLWNEIHRLRAEIKRLRAAINRWATSERGTDPDEMAAAHEALMAIAMSEKDEGDGK